MSVVLRLALLVAAMAVLTAVTAAPVQAATPQESARAREHFQAGQVHYDLKEYAEALKEFKDAYRFVHDPVLLFNIAQCHWKLGQNQEALDFYRNYLRRAPDAPNRPEVEKRVQEIERDTQAAAKAPPAPPSVAAHAPAAPPTLTVAPPQEPAASDSEARPVYRRWWFWTGAAVLVVGAVATAVALSRRGEIGDCHGLSPCRMVGQ